jgi:hypothetical protein
MKSLFIRLFSQTLLFLTSSERLISAAGCSANRGAGGSLPLESRTLRSNQPILFICFYLKNLFKSNNL